MMFCCAFTGCHSMFLQRRQAKSGYSDRCGRPLVRAEVDDAAAAIPCRWLAGTPSPHQPRLREWWDAGRRSTELFGGGTSFRKRCDRCFSTSSKGPRTVARSSLLVDLECVPRLKRDFFVFLSLSPKNYSPPKQYSARHDSSSSH